MAGGWRKLGSRAMSPFWIWTQVLIVACVLAGVVIAIVKLA
ncbi:MAG TPA: hypothetical protein VF250_09400 [Conexibacter sp.]